MSKPLAKVPLIGEERKGGHKCELPLSYIEQQLREMGVMLQTEWIVQVNVLPDSLEFIME